MTTTTTTTAIEPTVRWPWLTWNLVWCYDHGFEWWFDHYYRQCGECFHVYQTEQDLLDDHNAVLASMGNPLRARLGRMEFFCAHCMHDF